jgi:hypothetical protein
VATYYRDFKTVVIEGSPAYERSVVEQLDKLWAKWAGWAVLRAILDYSPDRQPG